MTGLIKHFKKLIPVQIILFYLFVTSGLIVNLVQLFTLIIWPFNKQLYRKLNRLLAYLFWSDLTCLSQYWSGCDVVIYMDENDFKKINKEHTICIMNHKYDIDWLMGWIVCQRTGLLGGSKIIGKSSLRMIPLIGWCWIFTESIFIERKWETDQKKLIEGLDKNLKNYPDGDYFNILMFCEGTRFTKIKHEESMKVAREKGLPELKHHLLPRTKGFSLLARGAQGRVGSILDLNVGIIEKDEAKANLNTVRNGIPVNCEMYVRRIPIEQVPESEEESAAFIHKFYQEKDQIYDTFARTGSFESLGLKKIILPKNYYDFYIGIFWACLLCPPLFYWIYTIVVNSSIWMSILLFLVFFLANYGADMFVSVTRTESGSNYGLKKSD